MKRILMIVAAVFPLLLAAETYRGVVVDEAGMPMSYVSVYLRNNPGVGTITDDNGEFELTADLKANIADEVVFSFIGYATGMRRLADLDTAVLIDVQLVEQPVMLEGAEVSARISKKKSKKIKREALERFVEQLAADFPPRTTEYRVVSSYQGSQDDVQLIHSEIIGTIIEYPMERVNGNDSIVVYAESAKDFTSSQLKQGYELFNGMAEERMQKQNKKNKKKNKQKAAMTYKPVELDEQMLKMHRFLWGGYTGNIIDLLNTNKIALWDYNVIGNNNVLTYTYKRNYLGIAKGELQIHFYIDPATYQVEKIAQSLEGELHIPFGYKLKDNELEFINTLQMGRDTLDSYRAKHVYVDVRRNVFFRRTDGNVVVREKNLEVNGSVLDRKEHALNYGAKAKVVVSGKPKVTLDKDAANKPDSEY